MNEIVIWIALVSRVTFVILSALVFPAMLRESKVPNGLGFLRRLIFVVIMSAVFANFCLALFQIFRLNFPVSQTIMNLASLLNSCSIIVSGIGIYLIYSDRYR